MAWQSVLIPMVRHLIGDLGATPTYADSRLEQAITISALIVAQEVDLGYDYTISIDVPSISPDPTVTATLDNSAIALFGLKAACLLNMNQYQGAVTTGIKVRDGDSEVDTTGSFKGYKDILELGPCGSYQKLLKDIQVKNSMMGGKAILSPYTHGDDAIWGREHIAYFFDALSGRG